MPHTMYNGRHRCFKCKGPVSGCRNGDLYCSECRIWGDPDDPKEARLFEEALYEIVGWKRCGEEERDDETQGN